MFLSIVPFLYSKRTAVTRSLVSLIESERFVAISSAPAVELPRERKTEEGKKERRVIPLK
jgi:hypothetical protein